jgi:plastocyanin
MSTILSITLPMCGHGRSERGDLHVAISDYCAATVHVATTDYNFTPMTSIVHPGDTVVWTNGDSVPHTATALDGKGSMPVRSIRARAPASSFQSPANTGITAPFTLTCWGRST